MAFCNEANQISYSVQNYFKKRITRKFDVLIFTVRFTKPADHTVSGGVYPLTAIPPFTVTYPFNGIVPGKPVNGREINIAKEIKQIVARNFNKILMCSLLIDYMPLKTQSHSIS